MFTGCQRAAVLAALRVAVKETARLQYQARTTRRALRVLEDLLDGQPAVETTAPSGGTDQGAPDAE